MCSEMVRATGLKKRKNEFNYDIQIGAQGVFVSEDIFRFLSIWHDQNDFSISINGTLAKT